METFILLPYMDPAPSAKPSQLLNELNRLRPYIRPSAYTGSSNCWALMDFRASSPNRFSGLAGPRGAAGLEDAGPTVRHQHWQDDLAQSLGGWRYQSFRGCGSGE